MKNLKKFTKQDKMTLVLCGVILAVAIILYLFLFLTARNGAVVNVTVDGKEYGTYCLLKDQEVRIETDWGYNVLHIENGYAFINEADCKTQVCVHTGRISKDGQTIVCLPHKVIVLIESKEKSEIDAATN